MSKGTSIKEALAKWAEKNEAKPAEATEIKLCGLLPPIEKMDASLSTIPACTRLSLSTNAIEKIANLNGLKNLTILSLARNNIKTFNGLEAVGETLKQLWISYNLIEKTKGIQHLKNLQVLYMCNNMVKDWGEFGKIADLKNLTELTFVGNPLEEKHTAEGDWLERASRTLKSLKKIDGSPIVGDEEEEED